MTDISSVPFDYLKLSKSRLQKEIKKVPPHQAFLLKKVIKAIPQLHKERPELYAAESHPILGRNLATQRQMNSGTEIYEQPFNSDIKYHITCGYADAVWRVTLYNQNYLSNCKIISRSNSKEVAYSNILELNDKKIPFDPSHEKIPKFIKKAIKNSSKPVARLRYQICDMEAALSTACYHSVYFIQTSIVKSFHISRKEIKEHFTPIFAKYWEENLLNFWRAYSQPN